MNKAPAEVDLLGLFRRCRGSLMPIEPLTASHFAPGFKKTIGVAHTNYLSDLKSEGAKREMLASKLPLADSSLICSSGVKLLTAFSRPESAAARALGAGRWIIGAFVTWA